MKHFTVLITASQLILVKNAKDEMEALEIATENYRKHEFEFGEGSVEREVKKEDLAREEESAKRFGHRVIDATK